MFKKKSVNSEEFIFYIDLISDFLKKKNLIKSINTFMKEKAKFNTQTSYGLLLFQKEDNPVTFYDEADFESYEKILDEKWETRETERSLFENGLFEILAYIFRKSRDVRKNYRVIIISDTPSTLSDDYHNALYDLLIKAKKFDAFIDIIRIGDQKFYSDDVKLKLVTSETHGGVLYCNDGKSFLNIFTSMIQSRTEFSVVNPDSDNQILDEDKIFYEKLAVDLISLDPDDEEKCNICEKEVCPICSAYSDEIHKCYNCNAKYHACCAADYSISNNIGFKHLFRCIQCDALLKLDEEYVEMIYEEEYETETERDIEMEEITNELVEEDISQAQTIDEITFNEEDQKITIGEGILHPETLKTPPGLNVIPQESSPAKKIKVGGYFGQEVTVETNELNGNLLSSATETIIREIEGSTQVKEKISITTLKPPKKSTIKFCQICGFTLRGPSNCPRCGFKN
ncbi:MAG: VWA domain-containing protein [Candidatus Lokiarchaeota archaeon]|nr:VWA domain-containing protein [Candidatus Lokiarchaeota archaeon]